MIEKNISTNACLYANITYHHSLRLHQGRCCFFLANAGRATKLFTSTVGGDVKPCSINQSVPVLGAILILLVVDR